MSNHDNTFSLADMALAGLRMIPHVPMLIKTNRALTRTRFDDIQSTGLMFETMAVRYPHRPFLLFEDLSWSYTEFNSWVNRLAHLFRAQGIRSGDCVALMFENRPELLACVLAVNKLGAIAGLINHNQQGEVLQHSLTLIKPRIVVVGEECIQAIDAVRSELDGGIVFYSCGVGTSPSGYGDLLKESASLSTENLPETRQITLAQKCYYIFTSGTTGLPKAASMTHNRWYKAGLGMGLTAMRLNQKDVMYCPLPLYHNNALTVALASVVSSGAALALSRKFSASRFWTDVRKHGATSFIYVGELCRYLLNAPARPDDADNKLRVIVGNGMRSELWEEFQARFGVNHICEFYGASENNTAFVNVFNLKRTAGFCPMSYAIVDFDPENEQPIKDEAGFMQRVGRGGTGLLLTEISDSSPFDGYSDRKATEAKVYRDVFRQGDCWFNTGDLVKDQGFRHIAFVDRMGDTFRWKGENVATTEVEGVIQRLPEVAEAVVYGVQVPHADGRAGMVAITLESGGKLCPRSFYSAIKDGLPGYALPLFVRLQAVQETTATFKIKKADLKREAFSLREGGDAVFVLLDRRQGYEALTPEALQLIENGAVRF